MPSCRSRKTGNCSDWFKKNDCHRRFLRLGRIFSYSRIACLMHWPMGQPSSMAAARFRRGTGAANRFFGLSMRFPVRDGTEKGRALNGIVCPWDIQQKRACHPRVLLAMNYVACL